MDRDVFKATVAHRHRREVAGVPDTVRRAWTEYVEAEVRKKISVYAKIRGSDKTRAIDSNQLRCKSLHCHCQG